jgi:hypothetical protein
MPKKTSEKIPRNNDFARGIHNEIKEEFRELNEGLFSVIDVKLNTEHQIEIKEYDHDKKNIQRSSRKLKRRKK